MKRVFKFLSLFGLLMGLLSLGGCAAIIGDENDSQVPQSTPAGWEGTVPGLPAR